MLSPEVVADIQVWVTRLATLGLKAQPRYSQLERSAYLHIPLPYLTKAIYPPELIEELEELGITRVGAYNIQIGTDTGTIGLTGTSFLSGQSASQGSTPVNDATLRSMGYSWVYLSPSAHNLASAIPTGFTISKTSKWEMTPDAYRAAYPEDSTLGTPLYRGSVIIDTPLP